MELQRKNMDFVMELHKYAALFLTETRKHIARSMGRWLYSGTHIPERDFKSQTTTDKYGKPQTDIETFAERHATSQKFQEKGNNTEICATDALQKLLVRFLHTRHIIPIGHVFERFPRLVQETARKLRKDIDFQVEGTDIQIDRSLLETIGAPLLHLLRNAIDHGIEIADLREARGKARQGRVTLCVQRTPACVTICVRDDGGVIDRDRVLDVARSCGIVDASAVSLTDIELMHVHVHRAPGKGTDVIPALPVNSTIPGFQ